jgi:hypothetical protein
MARNHNQVNVNLANNQSSRVDWDGGLQNSGSTLTKANGSVVVRNAADGAIRSTINKIVPGNVDSL